MANILTRQLQINGRLNRPTPRWQVISYNIWNISAGKMQWNLQIANL
jgi:hypothetical protein